MATAKPKDEGARKMFATIQGMKDAHPQFHQLSKLAAAHHAATQKYIETGKQLVDHILQVVAGLDDRLGDIKEVAATISALEKSVFVKMEALNSVLDSKLVQETQNNISKEKSDIIQFEKGFKQQHNKLLEELKKAEKRSAKAGKKGPEQLKQAIQAINDKIAEMRDHKKTKLTAALQMERQTFCTLLTNVTTFIDAQLDHYKSSMDTLSAQQPRWKEVAGNTSLDATSQYLIDRTGTKERTATALTGTEGYEEEEYYEEEYYEEEYEEAYICQAKALYQYTGSTDYELNFNAGDIINIITIDESTGWWTGELNGAVGPFPGNYVQQL